MKKEKMKGSFFTWTLASFVVFWMTVGVNAFAVGTHLWTIVHVAGLIISVGGLTAMGLSAKNGMKMTKEG